MVKICNVYCNMPCSHILIIGCVMLAATVTRCKHHVERPCSPYRGLSRSLKLLEEYDHNLEILIHLLFKMPEMATQKIGETQYFFLPQL